jgi:uncharacterized protein
MKEIHVPQRSRVLRTARRHGARNVRVFGSVRRREATEDSDVDFLVDWTASAGPLARIELELSLEKILGRTVQVATSDTLPWSFRPQIFREAVAL